MPQPDRQQIEQTLATINELVIQAGKVLGNHPDNRELQSKLAKLVSDRDRLERYQTSASLPAS